MSAQIDLPGLLTTESIAQNNYDCLHADGHQIWKTVTIHHFPKGVEIFINEARETWSDGANFETVQKAKRGEGDHERSKVAATRRAKTQVRRRCKMLEADCMMTLTYRENVTDESRVQADFKAFRKRLARLGQFHYVATLEKQQRGALHVHIACQQFPAWLQNEHGVRVRSYALISSMWSRVVGRGNGNVNFTKPRGRNSSHRIACYIAKYVGKALSENVFNAKSYWQSAGIPKPRTETKWYAGDTPIVDIVSEVAHWWFSMGYTDYAQFHDRLNKFYWFAASTP